MQQELHQRERKHLSTDALLALLRKRFERLTDPRGEAAQTSLPDALLAAFAMFSLKSPSLLSLIRRVATPIIQRSTRSSASPAT